MSKILDIKVNFVNSLSILCRGFPENGATWFLMFYPRNAQGHEAWSGPSVYSQDRGSFGILILAAQLARTLMNIRIEGFRVAWGAVFLIGGLWTVLNLASWPLAPIVLILVGVVLLGKAVISIRR